MVDAVENTHISYNEFFTQDECDHIISIFERDKDSVPYGTDTGYDDTLTATYSKYNWLSNPDIEPLNIPQRLFNLPFFKDWEHLIIQCWGNALHTGEDLQQHYHGHEIEEQFRRFYFINCNIFLGGEYNKTWYKDLDYVENKPGDIHIFSCELEHRVDTNTGRDTRYSMALDIYPTYPKDEPLQRYRVFKRESS